MRRLLLIASIVGFALAAWSFFAGVIIRPTRYDLMRDWIFQAAAGHSVTPEGRDFLLDKADHLQDARRAEDRRFAFAYFISFGGLLLVSASSLVAFRLSARPPA